MKIATAAILMLIASMSAAHATGRAMLCKHQRPAFVAIAAGRDAGTSQADMLAQVDRATAHTDQPYRTILRTAVSLAYSQPYTNPESFADALVARCGAYAGDIVP